MNLSAVCGVKYQNITRITKPFVNPMYDGEFNTAVIIPRRGVLTVNSHWRPVRDGNASGIPIPIEKRRENTHPAVASSYQYVCQAPPTAFGRRPPSYEHIPTTHV